MAHWLIESVKAVFEIADKHPLHEVEIADVYMYDDASGDAARLFFDPTPDEIEVCNVKDYMAGLITLKHLWMWDRNNAQHENVRRRFKDAGEPDADAAKEILGTKPTPDRAVKLRKWMMALKTLQAAGILSKKKPYKLTMEHPVYPVYFDWDPELTDEPDEKMAIKFGWGANPKPVLKFRYSEWSDTTVGYGVAAKWSDIAKALEQNPMRKKYIFIDETTSSSYNAGNPHYHSRW